MVLGVLEHIPDNYFYKVANCWAHSSGRARAEQQYLKSWGVSIAARLPYLIDVIVDLVVGVFATFGVLVGAVVAIGGDAELFKSASGKLVEKVDHFSISLFGVVISPYLAHKGREVSVVGVVGRVVTLQWLFNG